MPNSLQINMSSNYVNTHLSSINGNNLSCTFAKSKFGYDLYSKETKAYNILTDARSGPKQPNVPFQVSTGTALITSQSSFASSVSGEISSGGITTPY